jgi:hypothetical protein
MKPIHVDCTKCKGHGYIWPPPNRFWLRCDACDGIGRVWAPDAPLFGCTIELGERQPGEHVTLGSGERVRIMWHQPRKHPHTTFVGIVDDFDGYESPTPTPIPSCVGVLSVAVSRPRIHDQHEHEKGGDIVDPILRGARATRGDLI